MTSGNKPFRVPYGQPSYAPKDFRHPSDYRTPFDYVKFMDKNPKVTNAYKHYLNKQKKPQTYKKTENPMTENPMTEADARKQDELKETTHALGSYNVYADKVSAIPTQFTPKLNWFQRQYLSGSNAFTSLKNHYDTFEKSNPAWVAHKHKVGIAVAALAAAAAAYAVYRRVSAQSKSTRSSKSRSTSRSTSRSMTRSSVSVKSANTAKAKAAAAERKAAAAVKQVKESQNALLKKMKKSKSNTRKSRR